MSVISALVIGGRGSRYLELYVSQTILINQSDTNERQEKWAAAEG